MRKCNKPVNATAKYDFIFSLYSIFSQNGMKINHINKNFESQVANQTNSFQRSCGILNVSHCVLIIFLRSIWRAFRSYMLFNNNCINIFSYFESLASVIIHINNFALQTIMFEQININAKCWDYKRIRTVCLHSANQSLKRNTIDDGVLQRHQREFVYF